MAGRGGRRRGQTNTGGEETARSPPSLPARVALGWAVLAAVPVPALRLWWAGVARTRRAVYRIEHVGGGRRAVVGRTNEAFDKAAALRPHVARLQSEGAVGAVELVLVHGGGTVLRWPLAPGAAPEWPQGPG
jgi:hypothetical protein